MHHTSPKKRVLIAAAQVAHFELATAVAHEFGCETVVAHTAFTAIEAVMSATHAFNLILIAAHIPEVNGPKVAAAIRACEDPVRRQTPILGFASSPESGLSELCLAAGMNDYSSQPLSASALIDLIAKWLEPRG